MGCGQRDIDIARLANRFSAIQRLNHGQLAGLFLDQAGDPKNVFATIPWRHFRPVFVIGHPSGFYRFVDVRLGGFGDFGDAFSVDGLIFSNLFVRRRIPEICR